MQYRIKTFVPLLVAAGAAAATAASLSCGSDMPTQALSPDTTGAAVWTHLQQADYRDNWALWPGMGELYEGQEPHGMLLTTYVNSTALDAVNGGAAQMPDGAMIVKENYMPDGTLAAVTVMYKVEGYNSEHNDWFWSKHLPSGELDQTPEGMPMEGRVAGCQDCHGAQQENDYIFTGRLGGI
jgi:hypothetical protein